MPTFLSDPPQVVYLILGGLLVVTGLIAAQRQSRRAIIPFLVAFLLMAVVFLLDRFFESPREEAVRRTLMMMMAVNARQPDIFGEQLSDNVTVHTGNGNKTLSREELKTHAFWHLMEPLQLQLTAKDFDREDVKIVDENKVQIGFIAREDHQGQQGMSVYVRATYAKQSDGSFKLTEIDVYEYMNRNNLATVPGFP